jgi:hypothetical protein
MAIAATATLASKWPFKAAPLNFLIAPKTRFLKLFERNSAIQFWLLRAHHT